MVVGGLCRIEYQKKHEVCYVTDFLKEHQNEPKSFYEALDLPLPSAEATVKRHANLNEVTDGLYKKILMHGQLEPISKIAKKTGGKNRRKKAFEGEPTEKDNNYYDQDDSFIDDEEEVPHNRHRQQMQLVYAEYADFNSFEGTLADFVKSEIYRSRLEILDSVGRDLPEEPKRRLPEDPQPAAPDADKKPKEGLDKVKKKVKKSPAPKDKDKETTLENSENQKDKLVLMPAAAATAVATGVANSGANGPSTEKFLGDFGVHRMMPNAPMFQMGQFQMHNSLGYHPIGLGGNSRINPMVFYPMQQMGMPPLGFPMALPHKKESEIIEIDE